MTPTEDDIAFAKAWAKSQTPPVELRCYSPSRGRAFPDYWWSNLPDWLRHTDNVLTTPFPTEDAAWSALATALKPVIASVRPLIEAEALRRAAGVADQVHAEQKTANLSYVEGWLDAADIIFQRIEALIPAKGADRDAD